MKSLVREIGLFALSIIAMADSSFAETPVPNPSASLPELPKSIINWQSILANPQMRQGTLFEFLPESDQDPTKLSPIVLEVLKQRQIVVVGEAPLGAHLPVPDLIDVYGDLKNCPTCLIVIDGTGSGDTGTNSPYTEPMIVIGSGGTVAKQGDTSYRTAIIFGSCSGAYNSCLNNIPLDLSGDEFQARTQACSVVYAECQATESEIHRSMITQ